MNEDIGYLKREIAAMKSQIQVLESRARQNWVYAGGGGVSSSLFKMGTLIYGTEFTRPSTGLGSGYFGLKFKFGLSTRTTVPTTTPTANMASTLDGLAWTDIGWVCCGPFTTSTGQSITPKQISQVNGQPVIVNASSYTINNDTGGTATIYAAYAL